MFSGRLNPLEMLIPHTFTPLIDKTADPNAKYIGIWEEVHFIKDTH